MTRVSRRHWLAISLPLFTLASIALGVHPERMRGWTDTSGKFSIQATLLEWSGAKVRLERNDGRLLSIQFNELSTTDREYLRQLQLTAVQSDNPLRLSSSSDVRVVETLPPLDLPNATSVAPEGEVLSRLQPTPDHSSWTATRPMLADATPSQIEYSSAVIPLGKLNSWAQYSSPIALTIGGEIRIGWSITQGLSVANAGASNSIVGFNPQSQKTESYYSGDRRVTLLDHHVPSGITLVLMDHTGMGQGGALSLVTLSDHAAMQTLVHRPISAPSVSMNVSKVHWARLLDEEHVLAFVDQDIACWNLVSGECLYTVRHHDPKVTPVLSGGKRYWVLPQSGSVRWYRSSDGESLGEVTLDKGTTPQVAFSPRGDQLAIVSGRRLRVWDLPLGKVTKEIEHRRPIGSNIPVWIEDQWVMTSNGLVFDLALGRAVWQYDVIGANVFRVGNGVVVQRTYGDAEIDLLELPHPVAAEYLTSQSSSDDANAIPKSKWNGGQWEE